MPAPLVPHPGAPPSPRSPPPHRSAPSCVMHAENLAWSAMLRPEGEHSGEVEAGQAREPCVRCSRAAARGLGPVKALSPFLPPPRCPLTFPPRPLLFFSPPLCPACTPPSSASSLPRPTHPPCLSVLCIRNPLCSRPLCVPPGLSLAPSPPLRALLCLSPRQKPSSPRACDKVAAAPTPPARGKDSQSPRSAPSSQGRGGRAAGGAARRRRRRRRRRRSRSSANAPRRRGRRRAKPAPPRGSSRSLSGAHSSSESGGGAPGPGPEPGSERGHSGHGKR